MMLLNLRSQSPVTVKTFSCLIPSVVSAITTLLALPAACWASPEEYETFIEWGHSVYTDVLQLAREAGVKKLGLFHINQERTDRQMDDMVDICRQYIAEQDLNIECVGVASDMTFNL